MENLNPEIISELPEDSLAESEELERNDYPLYSPKFIPQTLIAVCVLLTMFGISRSQVGWMEWTRVALHRAINASTAETFGVVAESSFFKNIVNNGKNLVRLEEITKQIQAGGMTLDQQVFQNWSWPLKGNITRRFGWEGGGEGSIKHFNPGIEITAPVNYKVSAVATGRVKELRQEPDGSRMIVVEHAQGWESTYINLDQVFVKVGQWIQSGTVLGQLAGGDQNGYSKLVFELTKDNQPVDPLTVLVDY